MLTDTLMGLLVFGIAFTTFWGIKYDPNKNSFMSIEDTLFLRGFWCIIVVLVHVPAPYQNRIQDMLGSFAYIGVTFFFMTSAYGLKWSVGHKSDYMNKFWKRRLPGLLIPALITSILSALLSLLIGNEISILSFIAINWWVRVLLIYYLIFWVIYFLMPKIIERGKWQEVSILALCIGWSLIEYFTGKFAMGWCVERLGFAYGILMASYPDKVNKWIHKNWMKKSISLMSVSVLLGIAYLKFKPVHFFGDYLLRIILGIAINAFIVVLVSGLKVGNKVNLFLGHISYEIFLMHDIVFAGLIASAIPLQSGSFIVLAIFITVFLSIVLHKVSNLMIQTLFIK